MSDNSNRTDRQSDHGRCDFLFRLADFVFMVVTFRVIATPFA